MFIICAMIYARLLVWESIRCGVASWKILAILRTRPRDGQTWDFCAANSLNRIATESFQTRSSLANLPAICKPTVPMCTHLAKRYVTLLYNIKNYLLRYWKHLRDVSISIISYDIIFHKFWTISIETIKRKYTSIQKWVIFSR